MKKTNLFFLFLLSLLFTACEVDEVKVNDSLPTGEKTQFFVLSEGTWGSNNSNLAYYNLAKRTSDSAFFASNNGRGLGDSANDMILVGTRIFIVVNVSSQIEVIDSKTGKSIKSIKMFNGTAAKEPRRIIAYKGKIYVSSFDDTVTRIDANSLEIDGSVQVGYDPEGMCVVNDKLYVANSGGLEWANGYDKTVSIIDINSFQVTGKITVGVNPVKMAADSQGDIYLTTNGDYNTIPAKFQRIDTKTGNVQDIELPVSNFTIFNDKAYTYSYDYFTKNMSVQVYDCLTEKVINSNFISDGTKIQIPYSIQVNPENEDVFITDAIDNKVSGDVYCFDKNGKKKYRIQNVGINPNGVLFLN